MTLPGQDPRQSDSPRPRDSETGRYLPRASGLFVPAPADLPERLVQLERALARAREALRWTRAALPSYQEGDRQRALEAWEETNV